MAAAAHTVDCDVQRLTPENVRNVKYEQWRACNGASNFFGTSYSPTTIVSRSPRGGVEEKVTVGASIENVLINYILLHLLASPGASESAQRADTMLITL